MSDETINAALSIKFNGTDPRNLIDVLVEIVKITAEDGRRPTVEVAGKKYTEYELVKLVSDLLKGQYEEELEPHHQTKVDAIFTRRQHGYGRTAYNLANRANSIASDHRRRGAMSRSE